MACSFSMVCWLSMFVPCVRLQPALRRQLGGRIVVKRSAEIFMARTRASGSGIEQELAVQRSLQNRLQTLIGEGLQLDGALAGGFQPRLGVDLLQAQDAQTGAVSHFRM